MCEKERFYIASGKLFDNTYCLGPVSDFRDLDFVDMLNDLAEQLAEKKKECEGHYNNFVYQLQKTFDLEKQLKNQRHQICEEIKEKMTQMTGLSVEELKINLYDFTPKEIFNILDQEDSEQRQFELEEQIEELKESERDD